MLLFPFSVLLDAFNNSKSHFFPTRCQREVSANWYTVITWTPYADKVSTKRAVLRFSKLWKHEENL